MPSGSRAGEGAHGLVAALPLSCGGNTREPRKILMDITSTTLSPALCGVTTAMGMSAGTWHSNGINKHYCSETSDKAL